MKMFTEVINQERSRLIFSQTSIETDFCLEPVESPSAGSKRECSFKELQHWLHCLTSVSSSSSGSSGSSSSYKIGLRNRSNGKISFIFLFI